MRNDQIDYTDYPIWKLINSNNSEYYSTKQYAKNLFSGSDHLKGNVDNPLQTLDESTSFEELTKLFENFPMSIPLHNLIDALCDDYDSAWEKTGAIISKNKEAFPTNITPGKVFRNRLSPNKDQNYFINLPQWQKEVYDYWYMIMTMDFKEKLNSSLLNGIGNVAGEFLSHYVMNKHHDTSFQDPISLKAFLENMHHDENNDFETLMSDLKFQNEQPYLFEFLRSRYWKSAFLSIHPPIIENPIIHITLEAEVNKDLLKDTLLNTGDSFPLIMVTDPVRTHNSKDEVSYHSHTGIMLSISPYGVTSGNNEKEYCNTRLDLYFNARDFSFEEKFIIQNESDTLSNYVAYDHILRIPWTFNSIIPTKNNSFTDNKIFTINEKILEGINSNLIMECLQEELNNELGIIGDREDFARHHLIHFLKEWEDYFYCDSILSLNAEELLKFLIFCVVNSDYLSSINNRDNFMIVKNPSNGSYDLQQHGLIKRNDEPSKNPYDDPWEAYYHSSMDYKKLLEHFTSTQHHRVDKKIIAQQVDPLVEYNDFYYYLLSMGGFNPQLKDVSFIHYCIHMTNLHHMKDFHKIIGSHIPENYYSGTWVHEAASIKHFLKISDTELSENYDLRKYDSGEVNYLTLPYPSFTPNEDGSRTFSSYPFVQNIFSNKSKDDPLLDCFIIEVIGKVNNNLLYLRKGHIDFLFIRDLGEKYGEKYLVVMYSSIMLFFMSFYYLRQEFSDEESYSIFCYFANMLTTINNYELKVSIDDYKTFHENFNILIFALLKIRREMDQQVPLSWLLKMVITELYPNAFKINGV